MAYKPSRRLVEAFFVDSRLRGNDGQEKSAIIKKSQNMSIIITMLDYIGPSGTSRLS